MIELSLTIEIYIAGVKNRAGFATDSVWTVLRCRMPLNTYVSSTWFKAETLTKKIRRKYVFSFLEICNITLWFNVICTDLTMRYDVFDYLESTVDDCVMQRGTTVDICP